MIRELMDSMPIWGVLIFTLLTVLIAIELGYRTGQWRVKRHVFDSEALLSAMTGANLALLAFIMAFSFSMAAGHYGDRKKLIMEEANLIETAYLRTQLLSAPQAGNIAQLLREYTAVRVSIGPGTDAAEVITASNKIHERLWAEARVLVAGGGAGEVEALLIESLNGIFDTHERRVAAGLRSRVPASLWVALYVLLILSMGGIGYFSGMKGSRNPIASTGLALSFSLVLSMIADLDRPTGGLVQSDSAAMRSMEQRLKE